VNEGFLWQVFRLSAQIRVVRTSTQSKSVSF